MSPMAILTGSPKSYLVSAGHSQCSSNPSPSGMDNHDQARWNPRNIWNYSSRRHDRRHVAIAPEMCSKTLNEKFMAAMCARHTRRAFTDLAEDLPELRTTPFRQQRRNIFEAVTDVLYQPCSLGEGRRSRYRYTIELT